MKDFKYETEPSLVTDQLIKEFNELKAKLNKSADSMAKYVSIFNGEYLKNMNDLPPHLNFAFSEYLSCLFKVIDELRDNSK
tara:strand:- start:2420 stop:2662 length:243 start_codon:yes stop_codon:yes gene_type:complete